MRPKVYFTRSDGKKFEFDGEEYALTAMEGLDAPTPEITTEKSMSGNGDVVTWKRVSGRTITLTAKRRSTISTAAARRAASAYFTPVHTYEMQVEYMGVKRNVNCHLKNLKMPTGSTYKPLEITATFLCESGWLYGEGINGEDINASEPKFIFPYRSAIIQSGGNYVVKGFIWGLRVYRSTFTFNNTGDVPTWMRVVFEAKGNVVNPKITRGGKFVRVLTTLHSGDTLEIDTENRTIKLNGANALNLIDKDSNFARMEIGLGRNEIGYSADSGDENTGVRFYCQMRYGGL